MANLYRLIFALLFFAVGSAHAVIPKTTGYKTTSYSGGVYSYPIAAVCSTATSNFASANPTCSVTQKSCSTTAVWVTKSCPTTPQDVGLSIYSTAICPTNSTASGTSCQCNAGYKETADQTACEPAVVECKQGETSSIELQVGWFKSSVQAELSGPSTMCVENGSSLCSATYATNTSIGLYPTNGYYSYTLFGQATLTGSKCGSKTSLTNTDPAPPCTGSSGTVNGVSVCVENETDAQKKARADSVAAQAASAAASAASNAAKTAGASDATAAAASAAAADAAAKAAYNYVMNSSSSSSSASALASGASAGAAAGAAITAGQSSSAASSAGSAAASKTANSTDVANTIANSSLSSTAQNSVSTAAGDAAAAAAASAAASNATAAAADAAAKAASAAAASSLATAALNAAKAATDAAIAAGKTAAEQAAAATAAANAAAADATNQANAARAALNAANAALAASKAKTDNQTNDISKFCDQNPKSVICKEGVDSTWAGNCGSPPACTGDAVSCAIAAASFRAACALDPAAGSEVETYNANKDATGRNTSADAPAVNITSSMFDSTEKFTGQGLQNLNITVWGKSIVIPLSDLNVWLERLGMILQAVTFILAIRIVSRG